MSKKIKTALYLLGVMVMLYGQQAEAGEEGSADRFYEWACSKPDGANGYYLSVPEITVRNLTADTLVRYRMERADGTIYEESVSSFQEECIVPEEAFGEGNNHFFVWAEKEPQSEGDISEHIFPVERKGPEVTLSTEKDVGEWYQDSAVVHVKCGETVSGVKLIRCYQGEQEIKQIRGREGSFEIWKGAENAVPVACRAVVEDEAGRKAEAAGKIYIDTAAPELRAEGMPERKVTNQEVTVTLSAADENLLASCEFLAEQELPDGTSRKMELPPWNMDTRKTTVQMKCTESGIYRMQWRASDAAGHRTEKNIHFVLDKEAPVIRNIQELEGKEMQYFLWNEEKSVTAEDFTETEVVCCLDGRPYLQNEKIQKEGKHIFQAAARDAAGNITEETVSFRIDHTAPVICFDGLDETKVKNGCLSLKIYTENENDWITQILLNQEEMETDWTSRSYLFCLEESGEYIIEVSAADNAGNTVTERRTIEITEDRTIRLADPLNPAGGSNKKDIEEKKIPSQNEKIRFLFWMLTGGAVVMIVVMGILAEKEKTSRKREDAR